MKCRHHSLVCLSMFIASTALAQSATYFPESEIPDPDEVARLLSRPEEPLATAPRTRTRAVRLLDPAAAKAVASANASVAGKDAALPDRFKPAPDRLTMIAPHRVSSAGSLAIAMRFNSNSTDVLASAAAQLDAVAAGIKRLPAGAIVAIEGHTDAYGAEDYNTELSLRRAFAVRGYLTRTHQIPGTMLVAIGRGKSVPLNAANPYAPENRRVEFRAEYDMQSASAAHALGDMLFNAPGRHP
ncbi:MAG: OmpA family protein [Burkholderiales bacterium]